MTKHRQWVVDQVSKHNYKDCVELGVKCGELIDLVCSALPGVRFIGVDVWQRTGGYFDWNHDDNYKQACAVAQKYREGRRVVLWRMDTLIAADMIEDGSKDFVFIDADHETTAVMADIKAWLPKIRPGGMLCGDDANKESVRVALHESLEDYTIDGRCWFAYA